MAHQAARLELDVGAPALLIEVDRMTGFSEEFTHAAGAQPRNHELTRNLYAALIAYTCNLGHAGLADTSGISEDQRAWTSQWYLRQDALRAANTRLVNAHHAHPLATLMGGGALSSWDGQPFPQRGRSRSPHRPRLDVAGQVPACRSTARATSSDAAHR